MANPRVAVAALGLSATGLVTIALHEGYTDRAVRPLPGDKPTMGFGSTTHADGRPVQLGDRTTPPQALARALQDVQKFEGALKRCVKVPLHQREYDVYVDFAYNVGEGAFCNSTMVRLLNQQQYEAACDEFLRWTMFQGKDCRDAANGCMGLVHRRQASRRQCLGEPVALGARE